MSLQEIDRIIGSLIGSYSPSVVTACPRPQIFWPQPGLAAPRTVRGARPPAEAKAAAPQSTKDLQEPGASAGDADGDDAAARQSPAVPATPLPPADVSYTSVGMTPMEGGMGGDESPIVDVIDTPVALAAPPMPAATPDVFDIPTDIPEAVRLCFPHSPTGFKSNARLFPPPLLPLPRTAGGAWHVTEPRGAAGDAAAAARTDDRVGPHGRRWRDPRALADQGAARTNWSNRSERRHRSKWGVAGGPRARGAGATGGARARARSAARGAAPPPLCRPLLRLPPSLSSFIHFRLIQSVHFPDSIRPLSSFRE